jgi:Mlc titration factor MtfA (ptsG expression regulator)
MLLRWWRNRRRRILWDEPFPDRWTRILAKSVWQYDRLSDDERASLHRCCQVLLSEKNWEGCGGLFLSEEIRLTIAAQASLPILAADHDYYARVDSILVYPTAFATPNPEDDWEDDDLSEDIKEGMAVYRGPVLLSWDIVRQEAADPNCGHSVVVHEFVHQIDFLDYDVNGAPPIRDRELARRWQAAMTTAFDRHRRELKAHPEETFLTEQAGDSETEFFADAAEAFFCDPEGLKAEYPDVYAVFAEYFRLDPSRWIAPRRSA